MKTAEFRFGLNGLVSKQDPTLLTDGQYRNIISCEVIQEGGIASRTGRKLLGSVGTGATLAYRIQKMILSPTEDPSTPSINPRYIGLQDNTGINLWRTQDYSTFAKVYTGINSTLGMVRKRFQLASYTAGESGGPWAFIAAENAMLKDNGSGLYTTLNRWGILPAANVATAVNAGGGNLDGGDPASPNGSQPYDWRYTYVATDTNNEGNPSQTMLSDSAVSGGPPLAGHNFKATVTGFGTDDPQIGSINVYRRGGLLFDTWRLVGQVANPGVGSTWTLSDNIADVDLEFAPQVSIYNDPPVTSTVPRPITGSLAAIASAGRQTVNLTLGTLAGVTPGTLLHLFYDNPEDVIIEAVNSTTQFIAYFQHTHSANADFEIDTITGQMCNLAIAYQQFILVAGDPNNPQLIYRSLGGAPEYFPLLPADGTVAVVACGSPSNPILAMCEFRGQIITLNSLSIFATLIINGNLIQGSEVASRGLVAPFAWCKTDNEIWFLSTDGIYSWDGGLCRKRSEAIDPIFHQQEINAIPPLSPQGITSTNYATQPPFMEYYRGQVRLFYLDVNAQISCVVCEPRFSDRWRRLDLSTGGIIEIAYSEEDTGSNIQALDSLSGVDFAIDDQQVISGGNNFTSDLFTTDPTTQGDNINFDIRLPWIDFNSPFTSKFLAEALLDLDVSNSDLTGQANLAIDILIDYNDTGAVYTADPDAVDTLVVPLASLTGGRATPLSLLPALENVTGQIQSLGRSARAFSYHIYGQAYPTRMNFFRLFFRYDDQTELTAGGPTDWMNLGVKYDKKLYWMTVEFDVNGIGQTIVIDTIAGPGVGTYTPAVQQFSLNNPVLSDSSPGRAIQTFPINNAIAVCKEVRVRPIATASDVGQGATVLFKIYSATFEKEDYPPDITSFTPWETGSYEYDKYANQLDLEVNTNNKIITVNIQADGANVMVAATPFTFTVQSTESDRRRNITFPPGLIGIQWRIFVDPTQANLWTGGGVGMFQLFSKRFVFQPADRGDVGHTFDWDDLGHPYDKLLFTIVIEYDTTLGGPIVLQMDTLSGINGTTVTTALTTFSLGTGRGKTSYSIPAGTIAKMVRVYPKTTPNPGYKQWKYAFTKTDYPPDHVTVTEWRNASSPTDKDPSWLYIDMDTAGVAASVFLINENGIVMEVSHTGTANNRMKNYPIPVDATAQMWSLQIVEGAASKSQLFAWTFERWHIFEQTSPNDPPEIVLACPWDDFGYPYPKLARSLILTINTGGVPCKVSIATSDGGIQQTFTVNTTYVDRRRVLACNPNLSGMMWRPLFTPGPGGLAQVWSWTMDTVKEPPSLTIWTSYQQSLGYPAYKFLKQLWLEYVCSTTVIVTFVSDTGTLTFTLPPHATRASERYLFPTVWGSGLNKSKLYDVTIASSDGVAGVSLYGDASDIEWISCGADRHAAYQQTKLSSFMQIPL